MPTARRSTRCSMVRPPTGAYKLDLYPGKKSVLDTRVALFARRNGAKIGFAPLTSMFFIGKNDHRFHDDFRPQLHDSEGLLVNSGTGEWLWRPLRNPAQMETLGLPRSQHQRLRSHSTGPRFRSFQDLDLAYETRPSYWVEPHEDWGEGRVELVELPTPDETNDNIVAYWVPKDPLEPGKQVNFGYRITASLNLARLSPNARAINTFQTNPRALGSPEPREANARRFIIDFAGGDLGYFLHDPGLVELVPWTSQGRIVRSSVVAECGDGRDSRDNRRAGRSPAKPRICAPSCAPRIGRSPRRGRFRGRRSEAGRAARDHGSQRHARRSRSPGGDRKRRVPRRPADAPLAARASDEKPTVALLVAEAEAAGFARVSWVCADRIPQGFEESAALFHCRRSAAPHWSAGKSADLPPARKRRRGAGRKASCWKCAPTMRAPSRFMTSGVT